MKWRFTLLAMAYTAGILILSSIPGDPQRTTLQFVHWVRPEVQNLLHIPLFAGLSFLWCRGLTDHIASPTRILIFALLISIGVGVLDEWHQASVPGRFASLTDGALNVLGAALGLFVWRRSINLERLRP